MIYRWRSILVTVSAFLSMAHGAAIWCQAEEETQPPQYQFENIVIPAASADEPIRERFSAKSAIEYVEQGAIAWTKQSKCVACHTNGMYLLARPALTAQFGKPSEEIRGFFVKKYDKMKSTDLSTVGDEHDTAWIVQFINQEIERDGEPHKRSYKGTEEDLEAIAAWLETLVSGTA